MDSGFKGGAAAEILAAESGTGTDRVKRHHYNGGRITAAFFVEIAQRPGLKSDVLGEIERQRAHRINPKILPGPVLA